MFTIFGIFAFFLGKEKVKILLRMLLALLRSNLQCGLFVLFAPLTDKNVLTS